MSTLPEVNNRLLEVQDLQVDIEVDAGVIHAVRGVGFRMDRGEALGIVGESACGKSLTAVSLLGLTRDIPGARVGGHVFFAPQKGEADRVVDVVRAGRAELRRIRGNEIGIVFQDPISSLNPVFTVGYQIMEPLMLHRQMTRAEAAEEAKRLLRMVGIAEADQRASHFPHQLSGGMRQRVMIAIALSCQPSLLIADEPTTALDVTVQAQILSLLLQLRDELGTAIILITHDLAIVAGTCERVLVMYAGRIVEATDVHTFFTAPKHPYSRALIESIPRADRKKDLIPIAGQPPDLLIAPAGCAFAERCPRADGVCLETDPKLTEMGGSLAACHHPWV